jgi:hypothetical protein
MVINAGAVYVVINGLSDISTVDSQHMMSRVWDGPQCRLMTLMLRKFMKSSFDSAGNNRRVQHIDRTMS